MRTIVQAISDNSGCSIGQVILDLKGKLVSHQGKTKGQPKSPSTIANYLKGFYILDLFKQRNSFYSELPPLRTISLFGKEKYEAIGALERILKAPSISLFNEQLTSFCSRNSSLVKLYTEDINKLKAIFDIDDIPNPKKLQDLLIKNCGYEFVGNPGVGYLDIFYREIIQIDNYLNLLRFILENFQIEKHFELIKIGEVYEKLISRSEGYEEEQFKKHLFQLKSTHRIDLKVTKPSHAKNLNIKLFEIQGVQYGFLKILDAQLQDTHAIPQH
ncbi:hypothetical protein [Leptolyngbya sp. ST-U4]|uniref:hypothetical protein n=1 Tax=Leptolyngbya sp. ST-U4 TaxID=2933912 RepID=UPI00329863EC